MTLIKDAARKSARIVLGRSRGDAVLYGLRDWAFRLAYRADGRGRASARRLRSLANAYAGRRCFIIGNGPSLGAMDLAPLRAEVTFGLNRGYLLADRIGAPTTFLVAINHHVIDQFAAEMLAAGSTTFVNWHSRGSVPPDADATYLLGASGPRFSEEIPSHGVWDGGTVTYVAMQLAFYFGFHEVVLIGVDHSFATSGQPRALVTSTGQDPNHFDPRYFGPGIRWQLPDLETSELSYRLAKDRFERAGRQILDATVGGKLTIFPKREYGDVVTWPAGTRRAGKAFCQSSAASSDPRFIPDSER